ncbi:hypothetical protein HAX54_000638 [Datura stramonium]|uniref:Uncharacterized protein n=1 Tax=Datura stramonium TaxID=4076 RepID=A0ABS8RVC4_DATST|nr:hypothetical protein [Datura stramonium]
MLCKSRKSSGPQMCFSAYLIDIFRSQYKFHLVMWETESQHSHANNLRGFYVFTLPVPCFAPLPENEISDESITQEDDEAEENTDEEADATELAKMSLKRRRYTSLRTTRKKAKGVIAYSIPQLKMNADLLEQFGDPSMVDQLLEEMVGGGGTQRLRRCHNAVGEIEYCVEDADLVK